MNMNRIHKQCHLKACAENLELGLIGGVLASGVDSFWVITDMMHNGVSGHYIFILAVLLVSTGVLCAALIRHHMSNFKQQMGLIYNSKKAMVKAKNKHIRRAK